MLNSRLSSNTASFYSKEEVFHKEQAKFIPTEAEAKLVKKINARFIPFVVVLLFLQYLDKQTLSVVSIMDGFFKDTHITQDQYAWVGSFFYLGYFLMQLPNNYALQKFPIAKYCGVIMLFWGATLFSIAFATSFTQLIILRILLGFFEAISYPSMFLLIATFYRRSEQVIFFGIMTISTTSANIAGGFIGAGFLNLPEYHGIVAWQWAFIIYGSITMLVSVLYFFFLPDKTTSRWFNLTDEELLIIEERSRDNAVVPNMSIKYDQIWESLKEARFYCYFLTSTMISLQNGALTNFCSIIASEMGFSKSNSMILTTPFSIVIILITLIGTYVSKKKNEIIYVTIASIMVSLTGLICLAAIPSGGTRLIGLYLAFGTGPAYFWIQTSISNNVSGYTKKIFYTSGNLISYTVGNFIGPILFREKDSPRYLPAMSTYIVANILAILLLLYVRLYYTKMNKKRNLDKKDNAVALPDSIEDITDVQNENFVYHP